MGCAPTPRAQITLADRAESRKHPTRPVGPRRAARREFEYRRHGTVSLLAAMNVVDGTVLSSIITRNDSVTFIAFLTEIDQAFPREPPGAAQRIQPYLQTHQGMASGAPPVPSPPHPVHASWLNMIEIWFSILTRKVLRRGEFRSRQHLADKIVEFTSNYDDKSQTIPLELRRPPTQSRMNNPRRTYAALH